MVMIADTGRVEQRLVELPEPTLPEDVLELRQAINEKLAGQRLSDTPPLVQALNDEVPAPVRPAMATLSTVLLETLVERHEERVALAGTANLTRGGLLDFHGSLRPILEALEEEVVLLKLIGEVEPGLPGATGLRIRIGDENEIEDLRSTSVVSTGYGPGSTIVGGMGVLGPTRMDYPATIASVRAVARYVGDLLAQN
jgi:heat-inducible transcriptional repressor